MSNESEKQHAQKSKETRTWKLGVLRSTVAFLSRHARRGEWLVCMERAFFAACKKTNSLRHKANLILKLFVFARFYRVNLFNLCHKNSELHQIMPP